MILVVGASGFIGRAVVRTLEQQGHAVEVLTAPRLDPVTPETAESVVASTPLVAQVSLRLTHVHAVVNAAGNPDASERDERLLTAANAATPGVLAAACAATPHHPRLVHVSSAVVQGRAPSLDSSSYTDGFSAYARSKILGEYLVQRYAPQHSVSYRPPSVHAPDRRVTRLTARIARSPLATVARPGDSPTPQSLLTSVASAIAFLATTKVPPPAVVHHPSEGLTTSDLLELLGGRRPHQVPRSLAVPLAGSLNGAGRLVPSVAANARRLELMWFGQPQAPSWLTENGWAPAGGREGWIALGHEVRGLRQVSTRRSTR